MTKCPNCKNRTIDWKTKMFMSNTFMSNLKDTYCSNCSAKLKISNYSLILALVFIFLMNYIQLSNKIANFFIHALMIGLFVVGFFKLIPLKIDRN